MSPQARARARGGGWEQPPPRLQLTPGEVHVWRAFLDVDPSRASGLLATLDVEERARARRYRYAPDRERYVVSRGILRQLLGLYLGCRPAEVPLSRGATGKPSLTDPSVGGGLRFNLSHSGGVALYAFVLEREVGIDVEFTTSVHVDELARAGFLSEGEERQLRALHGRQRQEAILRCWTRKEAYLKAIGEGMSAPLTEVEVPLLPELPGLLRAPGGEKETRRWSLLDLAPGPGCMACLAVEGEVRVVCWEWTWSDSELGT